MKRWICLLVALVLGAQMMVSCGQKSAYAPTWQEQYDLGIRYLEEGKYAEAIIAFTAAIEIDPKRAEAYISRGDAYLAEGNYDLAEQDFNKALEINATLELSEKLGTIEAWRKDQELSKLTEDLRPAVETLEIPFTVDGITLGESGIASAKSAYGGRPYAYSNLMNGNAEDTIYTCFGMNDTPIPEGYEENQFGFFFGEPVSGGGIDTIFINDPSFTCLGALHVGDSGARALELFGFPEEAPSGELEWMLLNGAALRYSGSDGSNYYFTYQAGLRSASVTIVNGTIYTITLKREA